MVPSPALLLFHSMELSLTLCFVFLSFCSPECKLFEGRHFVLLLLYSKVSGIWKLLNKYLLNV